MIDEFWSCLIVHTVLTEYLMLNQMRWDGVISGNLRNNLEGSSHDFFCIVPTIAWKYPEKL
jgi:hypothetical protein